MQCYANLAVLVLGKVKQVIHTREAPFGSGQIDFRVCASSRAATHTQGESTAPEEYSAAPKRCSGVLEAPVGLQTAVNIAGVGAKGLK